MFNFCEIQLLGYFVKPPNPTSASSAQRLKGAYKSKCQNPNTTFRLQFTLRDQREPKGSMQANKSLNLLMTNLKSLHRFINLPIFQFLPPQSHCVRQLPARGEHPITDHTSPITATKSLVCRFFNPKDIAKPIAFFCSPFDIK